MATIDYSIKIDSDLKQQAEELFATLGLTISSATNVFLRQAIREQGIPFMIRREIPNDETLEAINEVKLMKENPELGKTYSDVDEMMEDLLKWNKISNLLLLLFIIFLNFITIFLLGIVLNQKELAAYFVLETHSNIGNSLGVCKANCFLYKLIGTNPLSILN